MPPHDVKRAAATRRAKEIYERLMALPRPEQLSNNEWAARAGVNTSFFTNLRRGSEPSVGNLRSVLEVVGISLPEFFLFEAQGRLVPAPAHEDLIEAFLLALPGLPRRQDRRAEYLSQVVQDVLALPRNLRATHSIEETSQEGGGEQAVGTRRATK